MEDEKEDPPLRELPPPPELVAPPVGDPLPPVVLPEPGTTIATAIGPTFASEVLASSLAGLPFTWAEDGVYYGEAFPADRVADLEALVAAHDPAKQLARQATGKQLTAALTTQEVLDLWDAAVEAAKPGDRYYWMRSYDDLVPEDNAKMARLALAAGVDLATLYDQAVTEPTK